MSDFVDLTGGKGTVSVSDKIEPPSLSMPVSNVPSYNTMERQLAEASLLVDDIVLKNYLTKLTEFDIIPLPDSLKQISDIRLFKITEMVYQNNEYSTYKFASVFNAVQNLNCGVFIIADSNGQKTDLYMGIRTLDDKRTTKSLKDTLRNALRGQFPGVKTEDLLDSAAEGFLESIPSGNIASVSCVANNKDAEFTDNERFIQGLDKLVLAMQGQRYTSVILAKSTSAAQLAESRRAYENIYTQLSPFANMQLSYGTNTALNVSSAFSQGTTTGTSHSTNRSTQTGTSRSMSSTVNESVTKTDTAAMIAKGVGAALLGTASIVAAPLTGGASLAAAGVIIAGQVGLSAINPKSTTKGTSTNESYSESSSESSGESDTESEGSSENNTKTTGLTAATSDNLQLTMQNKTLMNTLERIDLQLKRIDDCESLGMWECAAYFLSDSQETAEMAAGTYRALMKGEKSGVETSAINFWGRQHTKQLPRLREYITNFVHPLFEYRSHSVNLPVTASSLVSGNELAIQMGLPRKSVCGFPVIEHADFGREVVRYNQRRNRESSFILGNVFTMGSETNTEVRLDRDSMTMHTFVTGSTGSGKSNTVYEMLQQLRNVYDIPFLVIEPVKGEYKNVFGQFADVSVYGTNPQKNALLRINPFRFPADIHVLEHLDRLVELFNVCWPMYAAMPAILKEAMERSYTEAGWNLSASDNPKGDKYPNFADVLEQIENVIDESKYSSDSKGDYSGALCTRVRSLTNGLNGLIFTSDDLTDAELFDNNVIVDLSRIGSTETKSLIMGLLVMKLNEYRMTSGRTNSPLEHITVLEEAHVLLKRTSTEQSAESSNLLGKSVEMLANSIAEMRTYGEGFIIADQSPGLLDMSVIRNTNTKIILRLPERSDRELVGYAANLNEEQIGELSKLERGVAAIYQNDWVEPVLVKVNKCNVDEKQYNSTAHYTAVDVRKVWTQILSLLIQGRVRERLEFDVTEIERSLPILQLSSGNTEFLEEQISEYQSEGQLSLWDPAEFIKLSRRITGLLGVRAQVESLVSTSVNNTGLTGKLARLVNQFVSDASEEVTLAISQCLMKDISVQQEESEVRERIYKQWIDAVKDSFARSGGVNI
ncbi:ATP-binding protein [Paenibacillus sp. MMS20-IR301]|uniref:ATP-binding protein n=1 Tax=Paenibacillus sp. MMS20-IR301 TaxID=2895946 RepID=UPI0028ECBD42|nr:ATP-binding protein [Paenibacillus sp. MMS20-IR301]WNS41534.1 ATP-binding protein [Paenibacillus sp. MMS20-IR301]